MALSDMKVRSLKPRERDYKTSDGDGLFVITRPNGTKMWRMKIRVAGVEKSLSFGIYPRVTLLEARRLRDDAKRKIEKGLDPTKPDMAIPISPSFRSVADRWYAANEAQWVSTYAIRLRNRLVVDVFPSLGDMLIAEIRPTDVLAAIRKIEARGAMEMGRRVNHMVSAIFQFAIAEGLTLTNPAREIVSALAPVNPVRHRNAIPANELPALVRTMWNYADQVSSLAAIFTIHTMVRTNETRFAQWSEITADGIWKIPAERMKMRRDHIVPLTTQALAVLEKARALGSDKWVFKTPGRADKPISENAMLYFLYRLGYAGRSTMHGMRSSASTWLNEHEFNRDWIEVQLAHVDGSVRGVYNSALYLRQRREMLTAWSEFLEPSELL